MVGDINGPFSIMNRTTRKTNKETENSNNRINQLNLTENLEHSI